MRWEDEDVAGGSFSWAVFAVVERASSHGPRDPWCCPRQRSRLYIDPIMRPEAIQDQDSGGTSLVLRSAVLEVCFMLMSEKAGAVRPPKSSASEIASEKRNTCESPKANQ
jgi:hypothetical protein